MRILKIISLITRPAVLSLLLAIIVWQFLPISTAKYKITEIKTEPIQDSVILIYDDLDFDGISEYYYTGYENGRLFATLFTTEQVINQYNFNGVRTDFIDTHLSGDFNNDKKKEVYFFFLRKDSLFVSWIDYANLEKSNKEGRFLTTILNAERKSFSINDALFEDINYDGFKELLFIANSGFPKKPRKIGIYNIKEDKVKLSEDLGVYLCDMDLYKHSDSIYIIISNYASSNYYRDTSGMKMHDLAAYKLIFNTNLQPVINPGRYDGDYVMHLTYKLSTSKGDKLLSILANQWNKRGYELSTRNLQWQQGNYKRFSQNSDTIMQFQVFTNRYGISSICALHVNNRVMILDDELKIKHSRKSLLTHLLSPIKDINHDGKPELIFVTSQPDELAIYQDDLGHPVSVKLKGTGKVKYINVRLRGEKEPFFTIQADNRVYTMRFEFNPFYYLNILFLAGIYGFIFGIFFIIRTVRSKKQLEIEQKITELKLLSLQNQMDPHFTFNVLNTIGSVILQGRPEESYSMLMKYSKLLRSTISSSDTICRTLEEEVSFVTNYLELQKQRYGHLLRYSIEIDKSIDLQCLIPKMAILIYTENAIKHGILAKSEGGTVEIQIMPEGDTIVITITDDGVGRKQALLNKTRGTGRGLTIMNDCYTILNSANSNLIYSQIIDLVSPSGESIGTKVIINIPYDLKVKN